jgi:hypothetical protein
MPVRPINYRITIRGRVGHHWSQWLGEPRLSHRATGKGQEVTDLTGTLPDESALQGLLSRIWRLNLTALEVVTSSEALDPE